MKTVTVFFALEIESGCFEDMLSGIRRSRGDGFDVIQGHFPGTGFLDTFLRGACTENVSAKTEKSEENSEHFVLKTINVKSGASDNIKTDVSGGSRTVGETKIFHEVGTSESDDGLKDFQKNKKSGKTDDSEDVRNFDRSGKTGNPKTQKNTERYGRFSERKEKQEKKETEIQIYVIRTGAGMQNARGAAEAVLQAHRPDFAISAGFAGALTPNFQKSDLFFPTEVCDEMFRLISLKHFPDEILNAKEFRKNAVCGGRLLTFPAVVASFQEKERCAREFTALAVDMETYALADVCRERKIPLYCVRAMSDTLKQEISKDIQKIVGQKTFMAQLGAAVRTAVRRPGSILEMAKLREDSLAASVRLSEIVEKTIKFLCAHER
ncbi:MAG: hypothetical protein Q4C96_02200 [Planctomycetia bacterium]|nr:hypothetical protein [Planctomycetia bacterium]